MPVLDASRFQHAEKYAAYLNTLPGRLRSDLAWENLRCFLPSNASTHRALDLGGGTGYASLQLARMGFEVVLLDSSEEMLALARGQAEASDAGARISFRHADVGQLPEVFEAKSFDVVVCHNLLEYLQDSSRTVRDIARVLRKDGMLSILVRNRAGEVLRAAIKSEDRKLAAENLHAETVTDSLFGEPVRVFTPADMRDMLTSADLDIVGQRGVRVFSDYIGVQEMAGDSYRHLFELELTIGARPEFAAVARYLQVIAHHSKAPSGKESGV